MKWFWILSGSVLLVAAAAVLFIRSGSYNVAANVPHWSTTYIVLEQVRERSIMNHGKGIEVPALDGPDMLKAGVQFYHEACRLCHGAPGYPSAPFALGLYPSPPYFPSGHSQRKRTDGETFWVVKNGIKMTGMPAFGAGYEDGELWGTVIAFKRLPGMSRDQYDAIAVIAQPGESSADARPRRGFLDLN